MLKAPKFWFDKSPCNRALAVILSPFSHLYGLIVNRKTNLAEPKKVDVPVVCVGNVVVGGVGKTPFVLWLAEKLKSQGLDPHIILRGYGGQQKANRQVVASDTVIEVGDEALLYAEKFPTWVGGDRYRSACLANEKSADFVLMDDGLQNFGLEKDLSFLVVDRRSGLGNGRLLPSGPLREPIQSALNRCHCLIVMGKSSIPYPEDLNKALEKYAFSGLVTEAEIVIEEVDASWLHNKQVIAFSGIGRPEKFFESLSESGAELIANYSFADHHNFKNSEFDELIAHSKRESSVLVTTTKDYARLTLEQRGFCRSINIGVDVKNEHKIFDLIKRIRNDSSDL